MRRTLDAGTKLKVGGRIRFDDGKNPGTATVLALYGAGMRVQFDDRADTTTINYLDKGWMDYISVVTNPLAEALDAAVDAATRAAGLVDRRAAAERHPSMEKAAENAHALLSDIAELLDELAN